MAPETLDTTLEAPEMVGLNVQVRKDLMERLKARASEQGKTLIGAVNEMLCRETGIAPPLPLPKRR